MPSRMKALDPRDQAEVDRLAVILDHWTAIVGLWPKDNPDFAPLMDEWGEMIPSFMRPIYARYGLLTGAV